LPCVALGPKSTVRGDDNDIIEVHVQRQQGEPIVMVRCEDISDDASSFVSAAVHDIGNNSDSLSLKRRRNKNVQVTMANNINSFNI
jgi:hypothetical protein